MLEKLFKLSSHKTTVKTEILAGLTTFLAMAYILAVNPDMLSATGMPVQSVFLATAIASGVASILMGVLANYPVSLAPGMGVNAFFTYTVCMQFGYSWEAALAAVFVSGIVFIIISVTGLRKMIINAIPQQLKLAIGAGIGFFIAFIGMKNAGIIVANESTFVALGNLTDPVVLLAIFGLALTLILIAKKVTAAVFWGLIGTAVVGVLAGLCGIANMPQLPSSIMQFNFEMPTLGAFMSGFGELFAHKDFIVVIFSFLFVDFFDTAGTLVAVANRAGLVNEKGELENIERALLSDSVGTCVGAVLGTSTVTSFVESTSGVEVGGRTGLTAVATGILFLLSIVFFPLLSVVTSAVTAPALIVVGILMAQQLGGIDWDNFIYASTGFMAIIMMILCYSISDGIALGFITYGAVMLGSGKAKEVRPIIWILDLVFMLYFIL
ncbi:NCS2 family permease [Holdemania massiliensis]|uniref:NCS2 family permease n=1 Tax=Holdemania massiliensis TaxID=1468449 RepID=A0A6N7SBS3_9FIRM|nr:NCS2 family permease [Holdemania massiliensis]MSA73200.1 NCS2 family permease [Holdemania massiliensis]MSA91373.1 NCS2 family permease [Holdemania massiliensis]MSB80229.1 NCS2 family permease [Holdemania massiliensis]MSC35159.1 NCS2 family permease [Holdemania massiliensis]MSC41548.1 NCS2 family permease [Holdemania massiliensis]